LTPQGVCAQKLFLLINIFFNITLLTYSSRLPPFHCKICVVGIFLFARKNLADSLYIISHKHSCRSLISSFSCNKELKDANASCMWIIIHLWIIGSGFKMTQYVAHDGYHILIFGSVRGEGWILAISLGTGLVVGGGAINFTRILMMVFEQHLQEGNTKSPPKIIHLENLITIIIMNGLLLLTHTHL
jgi:hypothetical protein